MPLALWLRLPSVFVAYFKRRKPALLEVPGNLGLLNLESILSDPIPLFAGRLHMKHFRTSPSYHIVPPQWRHRLVFSFVISPPPKT